MRLSAPIHRLKHNARLLARKSKIPLHQALDTFAQKEGYASWSLLVARYVAQYDVSAMERRVEDGDMVLVGARPGHGKTSLCLTLVAKALRRGEACAIYSFELSHRELLGHLETLGLEVPGDTRRLHFDNSDDICSEYITAQLEDAAPGTWVVIDYLQLLDQRRTNPSLQDQVDALGRWTRDRGLKVLMISQVDKRFEEASRAMPSLQDVRLPNPLDLGVFPKSFFLHEGRLEFSA